MLIIVILLILLIIVIMVKELFRKFIRCGILTPEETNKLTVQRDDTRLNAFLKELSQKARGFSLL